MQIKNFTTMIPTGISFAASSLVGNCIGMNHVHRAQNYGQVSIIFSVIITIIMLAFFQVFSETLSRIFTDDAAIVYETQQSLWSLFIYIFFSTIKGVQNGIVRALGEQKRNTLITLIFAYGLGIPLAYVFCFPLEMGLPGMWFGISIANGILVVAIDHII